MAHAAILKIAKFVQAFFYLFLDIGGILLGAFLMIVGWWVADGRSLPRGIGFVVLALGVCAFLIHTGHYFQLKITRWIFGSDSYFHRDEEKP